MGWKTVKGVASVLAAVALAMTSYVQAAEVAGIKLDETVHVGNTDLKLNGAGIRYKAIFKVYVAGLYLKDKKTSVPEILASQGPRRVTLVMLRDLSNEDFGRAFMAGIHKNTDRMEEAKMTSQFLRFGELFASVPELKKGDVMVCDWVPGVGTIVALNGKQMGAPYPDIAFNNALLRIWLGDHPADSELKKAMIGAEEGNKSAFKY